ncbi:glycoside hydrolase family 3 protein [Acetivibrio mesophilus]|uniref:beta-glucosidase n=1 Tax=Acetivibrio mesophilus TaxID=2487273 RepID=A0A4Q0I432_9FIRM|nr:glycoside hydrolase family 3 protein [Acetivibrio mesophilus]ODM27818.1 beta-glucosidase [Clostridium sp. Bc-iso-3]RXE59018.1 glycoside hydrolase family 3 protein [Acetivibrio mesophilus]
MGKLEKIISFIIACVLMASILSACQDTDMKQREINEKTENLINQMTLDEKVGQMIQAGRNTALPQDVKKYFIGSILSGGGSAPGTNTQKDWIKMCEDYQNAATSTRLGIPIIYGVDAVHGHNTLPEAIIFPHNIGLGAAANPELMSDIASVTAAEMIATGVTWTFAPCVAVAKDIRWGRTYESFGQDPELINMLLVPYIKTMQDKFQIATSAKHYLADGATKWGTGDSGFLIDQGDAQISEEELREIYLPAYEEAVKAGVKTVMVSFSSWNGVKNHENKYLIQDILKGELGFEGFVITDYEATHQLSGQDFYHQLVDSVNAGIDMFMEPDHWKETIDNIKLAVEQGDITEERINDAVRRILKVKIEMGLFENPTGNKQLAAAKLGDDKNREIAKEAVRQSLVLLKNENNILPLDKSAKIFVSGPAADNIGMQCGGWTKTWQGGLGDNWVNGSTILDGFKKIAEASGGAIITDPNDIKSADVAVIVIGEKPYAEGRGDDGELDLYSGQAHPGNRKALEQLQGAGIPVVVILVSGRPRIVTNEIANWDAFVAAWLPGSEGDAVADVLYGDYEFKGKLPFAWPASIDNLPIREGDDTNLFPFGFGL